MNTSIIEKFAAIVGINNVMASETDRHAYSYDSAVLDPVMPALVVKPENSEALGKTVKLCNDPVLPLTLRGTGNRPADIGNTWADGRCN